MRFGILGTGRITRRLVADLQTATGVCVSAIASRDAGRSRWYADQYGIPAAVVGYQDLLRREDVDAVYIALPPSLHAPWAIAAAEANKHVLCEKPLATAAAEAAEIDAACASRGLRWLDATGWLHHSRSEFVRRQIAAGSLGQLRHITVAVSFFEPFQSDDHRRQAALGGGCLLDLGWYAAGLTIFALQGQPPTRVFASAVQRGDVPFRLTAMLWFDAPDGSPHVTAVINCGYDTSTRKWFEIAGDHGTIVCDDFTRPWPDRPARCWTHDRTGAAVQSTFEGHQEAAMISTFASERPLQSLQQQALATQRTLQALDRSLRSGQCENP